jgi:hypothetical protein
LRSWKAEGLVNTRGFVFRKPIKLGNCTILLDDNRMCINVEVQASDKLELEHIEKLALLEAKKTCLILSMVTGRYFAFDNFVRVIETTPSAKEIPMKQRFGVRGRVAIPELKASLHKEAVDISKLMKKMDPYTLKAVDYFEKGMVLSKWNEDAFLNFFKAMELFSKKYSKEADPKEIHRIFGKPKKKLTTKEKMLFTCQKLRIPSRWTPTLNELVDKRNKQDVAHAKLSTGDVNLTDVNNCQILSKLVIVNYLKKLAGTL